MKTGIWLDHKEAILVTIDNGEAQVSRIESDMDFGKERGGYGGKTPYMGQDARSDSKGEHRKQQSLKRYYAEITKKVESADELVLLGPGEAKQELENSMKAIKHFHPTIKGSFPAERMSENQLTAKVKELFGG